MTTFDELAAGALHDDDGDETDWGEVLWTPLLDSDAIGWGWDGTAHFLAINDLADHYEAMDPETRQRLFSRVPVFPEPTD